MPRPASRQDIPENADAALAGDALRAPQFRRRRIAKPRKSRRGPLLPHHRRGVAQARCCASSDSRKNIAAIICESPGGRRNRARRSASGARPLRHRLFHRHPGENAVSRRGRQSLRPGNIRHESGHCAGAFRSGRPAARDQRRSRKRVIFLWTSDEEIGSESSRKFIEAEARRSDAVFVLEPAFGPRGLLKTARKGVGEAEIIVHGRASHAGLAPQEGVNAIHELARQITRDPGMERPASRHNDQRRHHRRRDSHQRDPRARPRGPRSSRAANRRHATPRAPSARAAPDSARSAPRNSRRLQPRTPRTQNERRSFRPRQITRLRKWISRSANAPSVEAPTATSPPPAVFPRSTASARLATARIPCTSTSS